MHHVKLLLLVLGLVAVVPAGADGPGVGDPAPDFILPGSDGYTHALSDYRGHEGVVLAWFPRAFTRGCTLECRSLTEHGHLLWPYAVSYFMVSVDPLEKNRAFADSVGADFPLLSDHDRSVAAAYGVLNEADIARRWTFYIDRDGIIVAIDRDVNPETSAQDMASALQRLGIPRRDDVAHH